MGLDLYRERDHKFFRVELRDHGKWGVEVQILDPVDLVIAHMFQPVDDGERIIPAREIAIAWAKQERDARFSDSRPPYSAHWPMSLRGR